MYREYHGLLANKGHRAVETCNSSTITEKHEEKRSNWNCIRELENNQNLLRQRDTTDGNSEGPKMRK